MRSTAKSRRAPGRDAARVPATRDGVWLHDWTLYTKSSHFQEALPWETSCQVSPRFCTEIRPRPPFCQPSRVRPHLASRRRMVCLILLTVLQVMDKHIPSRSLSTMVHRHLSRRRIKLLPRKYNPIFDGKVINDLTCKNIKLYVQNFVLCFVHGAFGCHWQSIERLNMLLSDERFMYILTVFTVVLQWSWLYVSQKLQNHH